jgi:hypothetical protein
LDGSSGWFDFTANLTEGLMRYARGIFRLWLVLSCFWIVAVAAIGYLNWPTVPPEYQKDQAEDCSYPTIVPDLALPPLPCMQAEMDAALVPEKRRALVVNYTELAFIPPALIFVVGVGLTWAFRGFT